MKGCAVSVDDEEGTDKVSATAIISSLVSSRMSVQNAITQLELNVRLAKEKIKSNLII